MMKRKPSRAPRSRAKYRLDCRHFRGDKPCRLHPECVECTKYEPMGKRILIIKLGAMGDVLRTTPLLTALKREYPESHVTWVVHPASWDLLSGIPLIDRLVSAELDALLRLDVERFDLAINLDKEIRATGLMMRCHATTKCGFGLHHTGNLYPLDSRSEYAFELGLSDELKFRRNTKTYQEISFEQVGLKFSGEEYILPVDPEERRLAREFFVERGVQPGQHIIGLNTGAGPVFQTKKWTEEGFIELANRAVKELGAHVALLGGPAEAARNRRIADAVRVPVIDTGTDNSLKRFVGIVGLCSVIVTGDTLGMHLAIGQHIPVVALFGSTCPQEVELYGRGIKITAHPECAPCYKQTCDTMKCMRSISAARVFECVQQLLPSSPRFVSDTT